MVFTHEDNRSTINFTQDGLSGKAIPIDITNGSKTRINGRDVYNQLIMLKNKILPNCINAFNKDSPIAWIGFVINRMKIFWRVFKAQKKLAFNAAASFVPGQDYQGKDNGFSARASFVFKLGKLEKSKERNKEIKKSNSKIKKDILNLSKNKKKNEKDIEALNKQLKKQIKLLASLEKDNQILKENNKLILSENEQLISRLEDLIYRLEKIDKLAPTNFDISRK